MRDDTSKTVIGSDSPGLVILAMHRSGSSCLAGMLQCAGFFAGNVFLWNEDNRKGNQEDLRVIELNNLVLGTSGGSWSSPPERLAWTAPAEMQREKVLLELSGSPMPWMFKDPRTVFTLPFWAEAIGSIRLIGIFRNPASVAQSLSTRNGLPLLEGLKLWAAYNAALLREYDRAPFPIVCFDLPRDEFIAAVRTALETVCGDLVSAGRLNLGLLADFFDDGLVHQVIGPDNPMETMEGLPGADAEFAARLRSIYQRLCNLSGFVPPIARAAESGSDATSAPAVLGGLIRIEQATASGDLETAYQVCDEMVGASPRRADLWMRLLALAKAGGNPDRIESAIRRGLAMLPDDPYLWLELAKLNWGAGQLDEASRSAERAAAIAGEWIEPRLQLAAWSASQQRWAEVSRWLTPMVFGAKGNRWSRALLGVAFDCLGNMNHGGALIAEAADGMSAQERAGAYALRDWALSAVGARSAAAIALVLGTLQRELEDFEPSVRTLLSELRMPSPIPGNAHSDAANKAPRAFPGRVIFDHLPKTAGQAVNAWLVDSLGTGCVTPNLPGKYHSELIREHGGVSSILCAHIHFRAGEGLDPRYQYMTLVRDPIDRVISWLYFLAGNQDAPQDLRTAATRFLESEGRDVPAGLKGVSNLYVEHFGRIDHGDLESDDEWVAAAVAAVRQYDVVGLYQDMPRFLADVADLVGLPRPREIGQVNVTKLRPRVDQISPALRERIVDLNRLDMRFFAEVVAWQASPRPAKSRRYVAYMPSGWAKYEAKPMLAGAEVPPITRHEGSLSVLTPLASMDAGGRAGVRVAILNRSGQVWAGNSSHPLNLSYHWLRDSGEVVIFEGLRTPMPPGGVLPDRAHNVEMVVEAPADPGIYILVLTLVQEFVAWFEDAGFDAARLPVDVRRRNG